jgi:hypothetical protein
LPGRRCGFPATVGPAGSEDRPSGPGNAFMARSWCNGAFARDTARGVLAACPSRLVERPETGAEECS